jgi:uncharacterized protein YcbX
VWSGDVGSGDPVADADEALSKILGRAVMLVDTSPPDAELERSDPDSVLRDGVDAEVPALQLGRKFGIGDVVVKVIAATPRCAVPTLAHGRLPRDTEALRIPARLKPGPRVARRRPAAVPRGLRAGGLGRPDQGRRSGAPHIARTNVEA